MTGTEEGDEGRKTNDEQGNLRPASRIRRCWVRIGLNSSPSSSTSTAQPIFSEARRTFSRDVTVSTNTSMGNSASLDEAHDGDGTGTSLELAEEIGRH
jgi:hypothetical protein